MKNLLYIFLGLGIILFCSCSNKDKIVNEENLTNNACANDYATYYHNGTLFNTVFSPDGGEIMTPNGENCGIGATLNESANILTMRIFDEEQHLSIHADITNLNEALNFRFLEHTNNNIISTFNDLTLDDQNYILITELDTLGKTIKGEFKFKIENSIGDTITVTDGLFNCSYYSF